MLSDHVRARLAELQQRRPHATASMPLDGSTSSNASSALSLNTEANTPGPLVPSPTVTLRGCETVIGDETHWLIEQPIAEVWPASTLNLRRLAATRAAASSMSTHPPESTPLDAIDDSRRHELIRNAFPEQTLLLDLETCGLAGSTIFLIGLIRAHAGELILTQLWARHYGEESAILRTLLRYLTPQTVLVTFNGKSFDWPQVVDRSRLHRLSIDAYGQPLHWDLLHESRRRWRANLPNCRLQTLERYICGRHRRDDLSGRDIPPAYHDYVRTGRLNQVEAILHHNALDLVTLLQLAIIFYQTRTIDATRATG